MIEPLKNFPSSEKKSWPWQVPDIDFQNPSETGGVFPKITVITPSYNQAEYLEATIRSVIFQGYPNLEYLIIDGGSTDHSVDIIKKYSPWITYWVSEKDSGQSEAINKGLKIASGDIINWLNSDDYYEPNALFKVAEAFKEKEVLMVGGRSYLFKGERVIVRESQGTDIYPNNLAKTIGWARIDQPETFFRKAAITMMGPLDNRLHFLMDRDWWVKFLFYFGLNGIKIIPDFLVNFRLHEESKTVSQAESFQIEHDSYFYQLALKANVIDLADIIKRNVPIIDKFEINFTPKNQDLIVRAVNYYFLLRANEFYVLNQKNKANIFLKQIDLRLLESEDKRLWRKLYYRNKFIPAFVINLFRSK